MCSQAQALAEALGWSYEIKSFIYRLGMRFGPQRITRDIRIVHAKLLDRGQAVWRGTPSRKERRRRWKA